MLFLDAQTEQRHNAAMVTQQFIYALDLVGVAAFAFSGAISGLKRRPDPIGLVIVAGATAIGGGMVRDVILQRPWVILWDVNYLLIVVAAAIITFCFPTQLSRNKKVVMYFDAVALGVFSAIGTALAWELAQQHGGVKWSGGVNPLSILVIAGLTGAGGGIIRDLLLARVPLLLYREIYLLAVLVGAAALMIVRHLGASEGTGFAAAWLLTTLIRVLAIRYGLSLPRVGSGS